MFSVRNCTVIVRRYILLPLVFAVFLNAMTWTRMAVVTLLYPRHGHGKLQPPTPFSPLRDLPNVCNSCNTRLESMATAHIVELKTGKTAQRVVPLALKMHRCFSIYFHNVQEARMPW